MRKKKRLPKRISSLKAKISLYKLCMQNFNLDAFCQLPLRLKAFQWLKRLRFHLTHWIQ